MIKAVSPQDEISELACRLSQDVRKGKAPIFGLGECLNAAVQEGIDRGLARSFLIGLAACKKWYERNRQYYIQYKVGAEFRRLPKGKVTVSFEQHSTNRTLLNRFTLEEFEVLLLLGYMQACGANTVSKKYLAPLSRCIARIFKRRYSAREGEDAAQNIYKNLWKRGDVYRKKNGNAESFSNGSTFFNAIHSTLNE